MKTYKKLPVQSTLNKGAFVQNIPNDQYHAMDGISSSDLYLLNKSPAKYKYDLDHPELRKTTDAMEFGTIVHTAVLEPQTFELEYNLLPKVKSKSSVEYKQACTSHDPSKIIINSNVDKVLGIRDAVHANKDAMNILNSDGYAELSAFVQDSETDLFIKCRFDYITTDGIAIDLKTTSKADEYNFASIMVKFMYHMRMAMYMDIYEQITGKPLNHFYLLVVEKEPPYENVLYELDFTSYVEGKEQYRKLLKTYIQCQKTKVWKGLSGIHEISLPNYALSFDEDIITGLNIN